MTLILFIMIIIPLICFLYWVYFRPTSLWTGFFFTALLGSLYVALIIQVESISRTLAIYLAIPILIGIILVGVFGLFSAVIALFWNERILVKREGFSLRNLLPLFVAVGLLLFQGTIFVLSLYVNNLWLSLLSGFLTTCFTYTTGLFFFYFITSVLYNHFPLKGKVDYIIILGAGLSEGEYVTPLLASRIEVAVKLFNKQKLKFGHEPTIILSGGQGMDEKISEAQAMFNYLEEKSYPLGEVYLEDRSTNTQENMKFSEKIIYQEDSVKNLNKKNLVIATNNYHVLRAGKLANRLGIFARAVGSKTKAYYLPIAFIREYIAYLVMTKKRHIIFFGGMFVFFIVLGIFLTLF